MEGKTESHMTSAAAFVEGGIQDSCDDACSICLEEFCESDPSTVTTCKHEFHLQCILEWCQRSSQCPMCWQPIRLKDPTSQELFEAVEHERNLRVNPPRNAAIFHHPAFGDFELQHLRMGDADFEERIIQHLAAAAAMGRAHHLGRREGQRPRASAHGHPHFQVFSTQPSAPPGPDSAAGGGNEPAAVPIGSLSSPMTFDGDAASQPIPHLQIQSSSSAPGSTTVIAANRQEINANDSGSTFHSSQANQDRAGPSEFQSFSDSLRSKLNAMSLRYKESISKGARGWKERLFTRSPSLSESGPEVRREAGIAGVSRLMESQSLQTRGNNRAVGTSLSNHLEDSSIAVVSNQNSVGARGENSSRENNTPAACSAGSRSD